MAEPLKVFFSPQLASRLAESLAAAWPAFDQQSFLAHAVAGLEDLELLDRARHLMAAMARHLPAEYPQAIAVLLRSLGPEHASDELLGLGMAPFFYLPHTLFVAEHGRDHFDLSMQANRELTKRFSAEASIRPYLALDPERALGFLRRWASDSDPHVRRLVSEGTRLRLPWAPRVAWLDRHPERVAELLTLLRDDPTTLVRRSVANNLNDLGKVAPELLVATCATWLEGATPERRGLIEHALRSAIKRGEPGALALLGYGGSPQLEVVAAAFDPPRVAIGGSVDVAVTLRSTAERAQDLLVDLAVHFVKARGHAAPKVFKLERVTLAPGQLVTLGKRVSLAVHTTRVPRPGRHAVEVLVNGVALRVGEFVVVGDAAAPGVEAG